MQEKTVERLTAEQIQAMFDRSPFISGLQLQVQSLDYDAMELTVSMPLNPSMERRAGTKQFHGGPIASFIDTIGDFVVGMMVGGGVPTINIRIDYLKPAVGDALTATARARRMGRTVAVADIDVFDEKNSLVAIGRGTYFPKAG
ncbi:MAG: PaaI family thioesterase [Alphaproteobacteria bacterium]|nr:PaaI family thioesterase [Alphaproteobacteria bacterium]MCZ6849609.1 PaaI family thioesterase [Alphaproteobacteria bacterium]